MVLRRSLGLTTAVFVTVLVAGCGSDGGDAGDAGDSGGSSPSTTAGSAPTTTTTADATTTTEVAESLQVLVTNDDGVGAEGLDSLVTALSSLEAVTVVVVAPSEQQSGTGGSTTEGPLTTHASETAGGHEATAVDGFPADTIRVALDDLGLEPDLVVAGINEGQNVGPLVEVSGTVGAARAAASRGIPALAVSQGLGESFDYEVAAGIVADWIEEHREALLAGAQGAEVVVSLNVPSCDTGELRGTLEVVLATDLDDFAQDSDCTSTLENPPDDVVAFVNGYAALTEVSVEPAPVP
ncbi:MAG: 5'/3'-nucleotidase SurE [Acidimicrobiia bacterium]|nr:5'/3'-nucleotidase SurE [Acidimicrobiia bacterium]